MPHSNHCKLFYRAEARALQHLSYARAFRFTLACVRGNIFLVPLLWTYGALGEPLRMGALFLCIIGFSILRDAIVVKMLSVVTVWAELNVTFRRLEVREVIGYSVGWQLYSESMLL